MTSKDEAIRSRVAIRCAKAAMLLYGLGSSRNLTTTADTDGEEKEAMQREMAALRIRLAREKIWRQRIRLCGMTELILMVIIVLLLSTFLLMLLLKSR